MHALVTGGAGFIGSHLVERILRDGHSVTAVLKPGESEENLAGLAVRKITCDVLNEQALAESCAGVDIIFHLAARTDLDGKALSDYDVNLRGTENIVAAAEVHAVKRLVFYSSMLAVPLTGRIDAISEDFSAAATSYYGMSKREGERIVSTGQIPWTVIRPTLVFGPRECSTMRAFFCAVKRRQFMLIGPDVWQSFVYVKNLVEATYVAALAPEAAGQIFFVSDERPYTLAEFASAAAKALKVGLIPIRLPRSIAMLIAYILGAVKYLFRIPVPLTPSRVRTMTTHYVYSIEKARRLFGYRAPYDLAVAVRETAIWYEERQLL